MFASIQKSQKRDVINKMNQAELVKEQIRRFEETNLCADLMPFEIRQGAEVLFDRLWIKRLEACPDYVKVAASVWSMARTNWQYYPEWRRFFNRHREELRKIWMTDQDFSVLHTFPKPFTLYRGYNKPRGRMGFSWSLDKSVAARIPRHAVHGIGNPWIITATANPEDVLVYRDNRKEREVIIDPKKILKVLKDEQANKPQSEGQNQESKSQTPQGGKSIVPLLLKNLKCLAIIILPNIRAAHLTGGIFKVGDRKEFKIDGRQFKIHCLEIREESVLIKIAGIKEPQEFSLPPSEKRWKSYFG